MTLCKLHIDFLKINTYEREDDIEKEREAKRKTHRETTDEYLRRCRREETQ